MSSNTRLMKATPDQVWEVLSDGWLYPLWVVGASRMREVDEAWPALGARLKHSVGSWPLLVDDETESLECRPGSLLRLKAHTWPVGAAEVVIHTRAHADGVEVVLEEQAIEGPGALMPKIVQDPLLGWRNVETLRRLAYLVEGRPQQVA